MSTKHCGECKQALASNVTRCSCGWQMTQTTVTDYRCQYHSNDRRCPLPGTICPYPYSSAPWYCFGHWQSLSDPKASEAILLDAEKNYQALLAKRRDWRDRLFDPESN